MIVQAAFANVTATSRECAPVWRRSVSSRLTGPDHPRTFSRWKAEERDGPRHRRHIEDGSKGGRPRKSQFMRDLVVRMARENDWGLTRIAAEISACGCR